MAKKPVILIVTCYRHPDYVRAVTLRRACEKLDEYTTIELKNTHKGILRYPQVIWQYFWLRMKHRPTVVLLTFRGYELLPLFCVFKGRATLAYDEFINPLHWVAYEHKKLDPGSLVYRIMRRLYRWCINRCDYVLLDTKKHVELSRKITGHTKAVYAALPVGADEALFVPQARVRKTTPGKQFVVLYYGTMLPLHGLDIVLQAAEYLRGYENISFDIIGGSDEHTKTLIRAARANGAHVTHTSWVETKELPKRIASVDVCLGGPFGKTEQASVVVTGKTYQFLSMSMPTIISDQSADEILVDRKTVMCVPLGDPQALADTILWCTHNTDRVRVIAKQGHDAFMHHYTIDALGDLLGAVLNGKSLSKMH